MSTILLPGKSHGQRSLGGCSPWGRKESDMTERFHFTSSQLGWRVQIHTELSSNSSHFLSTEASNMPPLWISVSSSTGKTRGVIDSQTCQRIQWDYIHKVLGLRLTLIEQSVIILWNSTQLPSRAALAHCCWLVAQLCLTLCDPIACNPPGNSVHGISQLRIL